MGRVDYTSARQGLARIRQRLKPCVRLIHLLSCPTMRFLFLLVLLANVALLAFGQGFMGLPPSEEGRNPRVLSERNQHIVEFGPAILAEDARRPG